jgi:hypothetical protein
LCAPFDYLNILIQVLFTGFNSTWTQSLHHNEGLYSILDAFVDKEMWASIVHKQSCLVVGGGATGGPKPSTSSHKQRQINLQALGREYYSMPHKDYVQRAVQILHTKF